MRPDGVRFSKSESDPSEYCKIHQCLPLSPFLLIVRERSNEILVNLRDIGTLETSTSIRQ